MIAKVNGKELYYVKQDHPFNKTLEKFIGIGILNGHAIYMVYCAYRDYVQGGRKKEEKDSTQNRIQRKVLYMNTLKRFIMALN